MILMIPMILINDNDNDNFNDASSKEHDVAAAGQDDFDDYHFVWQNVISTWKCGKMVISM